MLTPAKLTPFQRWFFGRDAEKPEPIEWPESPARETEIKRVPMKARDANGNVVATFYKTYKVTVPKWRAG